MISVTCFTHGISFDGWKSANKHAKPGCFLSAEISHTQCHKRMRLNSVDGRCEGEAFFQFICDMIDNTADKIEGVGTETQPLTWFTASRHLLADWCYDRPMLYLGETLKRFHILSARLVVVMIIVHILFCKLGLLPYRFISYKAGQIKFDVQGFVSRLSDDSEALAEGADDDVKAEWD